MDPAKFRRAATALAVTLTASLATVATAPAATAATRCEGVAIAAHRGAHDSANTENTIRSTRRAIDLGADVYESDLRLTRDGIWMMMHDPTVDRTTNGRGAIANKTYRQVKRLRTSDGVLGGVPTLRSVLDTLDAAPRMRLQIEIKPYQVGRRALDRLFRIFAEHRLQQRLSVMSFSDDMVSTVRRRHSQWQTAYITRRQVPVSRAKSLGRTLTIEHTALTGTYARALQSAGIVVSTWTVNSTDAVDRALERGAQIIVTDRAAMVRQYCAGTV